MDCGCMEEVDIIYYPYRLCFYCLYLYCSRLGVQIFPLAQFYPWVWLILNWQADDMWVQRANVVTFFSALTNCQNAHKEGI